MKAQSTSKGAVLLTIGNLVSKIMSLIYVPVLQNILTEDGYGLYTLPYEIFIFAYVILTEGFAKAVTKIVAEYEGKEDIDKVNTTFKTALKVMFILGGTVGLIMFITAIPLAYLGKTPESYLGIRALAPAVLTTSIVAVLRGYLQGRMYMKPYAQSQIIEQTVNLISSIGLAFFFMHSVGRDFGFIKITQENVLRYAVFGGVFGTTIASIASLLFLVYVYNKYDNIRKIAKESSKDEKKTVLRYLADYSIPLTLGTLFLQLGNLVDIFVVRNRLITDNIKTSQAILSNFRTMINVPIGIIIAITMAVFPAFSKYYANGKIKELTKEYSTSFKVVMLIAIPAAFGISGTSNEISKTLFRASNISNMNTRALILALGGFIVILTSYSLLQNTVLQATGFYKESLKPLVMGIVVKTIFDYILVAIPQIGLFGAIYSQYISYIFIVLYSGYILKKKMNLKVKTNGYIIGTLISSGIMWLVLMGIHLLIKEINFSRSATGIMMLFQIVVGILVYGILIFITGTIRKSDLNVLPNKLTRLIPKQLISRLKD